MLTSPVAVLDTIATKIEKTEGESPVLMKFPHRISNAHRYLSCGRREKLAHNNRWVFSRFAGPKQVGIEFRNVKGLHLVIVSQGNFNQRISTVTRSSIDDDITHMA